MIMSRQIKTSVCCPVVLPVTLRAARRGRAQQTHRLTASQTQANRPAPNRPAPRRHRLHLTDVHPPRTVFTASFGLNNQNTSDIPSALNDSS